MSAPREPRPDPGPSTLAVHAGGPSPSPGAPVVAPVVHSATFFYAEEGDGELRYTRYLNNPTLEAVARRVAALEGTEAALVTSSGMAAMAMTLLALTRAGDHIVAARDLYGGTVTLLSEELPRLGIETTFVPGDPTSALRPETKAIVIEVPSNPVMRVPDLPGIARAARAAGVALVVDATFASPVNLRAADHGASAVVHSGTKYLGGHSDVTAGVVAGDAELIASVRRRVRSFGPVLDPGAAATLERGMKTLAVRVQRHNANAAALADWLAAHPAVESVSYPGRADHPDHERAAALMSGFGGMLGFAVRGGDEAALRALRRLRILRVAPSLGSVESLVSMPRYTSHASLTDPERAERGIPPGYVRVSVGVEDLQDLREDLARALEPER
ncbi:MAG TPA: aminotransferase class I/II-fold pyridoxal phosphate-dependent enzyme [Longimicrobiales bacterium]|nr:aminotransferase class I/II-fold pyridoxal phosphate-dependent enzyme [Longimicrobiales bacterium]